MIKAHFQVGISFINFGNFILKDFNFIMVMGDIKPMVLCFKRLVKVVGCSLFIIIILLSLIKIEIVCKVKD